MAERPPDLPEFTRPPVVEVAIGIQFAPIPGFCQAHNGLFWDRIRESYPRSQDQARLDTPIEALASDTKVPALKLELLDSPPVNRAWFISDDDSQLAQLQDDRLIHNWRRREGRYPRFEHLLDTFWSHFDTLAAVLSEAGLSAMEVRQAEVTYINWIDTADRAESFRPTLGSGLDVPGVGPAPELQRWGARYPVAIAGELRGKLSVDFQPTRRIKAGEVSVGYQLSLTFRAPTVTDTDRGAISSTLELGHSTIVRSFTALTTDSMHTKWGRTT